MERLELITVCKTCGGHLVLDEAKRVCVCQSCGNSFDYEYFFGKDLLGDAGKTLSRKEFVSAYDMFNFYLAKDPNNKEAVIGKIFSALEVTEIKELTADRLIQIPSKIKIEEFKGKYTGELNDMVNLIDDSLDAANKARALKVDLKEINSKCDNTKKEINKVYDSINKFLVRTKNGEELYPSEALQRSGLVAVAMSIMAIIMGVLSIGLESVTEALYILLFVVILNLAIWLPMLFNGTFRKNSEHKACERRIKELEKQLAKERLPAAELENRIGRLRGQISKNILLMKKIVGN